ncbi:isochorismatase family protein [Anaerococcus tetradius]|uniref:Isochorismatase family protein n=1 Tax=Anaerococcus tetradius ATCC 35098 TaxID=525255 RepID=C2CHA6_9FIRM|nr:isochorismatase family protein [Anaerococcus tetradius]EEI82988.1 isochorismatase family protein [Anaerococcus tetradius ATCC 35098]
MSRRLESKFYVNSLEDGLYQNKKKTLLLVVDEQPKLMTTMENGEKTIINTLSLVKAFKEYDMAYLATEQYPKGLGRSDDRLLEEIEEGKIFPKTLFDAAIDEVREFIEKEGIEKVLVTGAEGHICIYQTARSFLDMGLDVFLVEDAISSFSEGLKLTAMGSLEKMGAVRVNTEMILFDLARDAKDPHFKFISALVKSAR